MGRALSLTQREMSQRSFSILNRGTAVVFPCGLSEQGEDSFLTLTGLYGDSAGVACGRWAVLGNQSVQTRRCIECAAAARERADSTLDPYLKQGFIDLEDRWLRMAESYQLVARLDQFIASAQRGWKSRKDPFQSGQRS
jgi:hypothetical protein